MTKTTKKAKKHRIIQQLRYWYPVGMWYYRGSGHYECWNADNKLIMEVQAYAQLTPQHDGDDETYMTIYQDMKDGRIIGTNKMIYDPNIFLPMVQIPPREDQLEASSTEGSTSSPASEEASTPGSTEPEA